MRSINSNAPRRSTLRSMGVSSRNGRFKKGVSASTSVSCADQSMTRRGGRTADLRALSHDLPETWLQLETAGNPRAPIDTTPARSPHVHGVAVRLSGSVDSAHSPPICLKTETISMATMAASAPLLPALVPARSIACSMVSTVRTPKAQGTPVSSWTLFRPPADSPAHNQSAVLILGSQHPRR